MRTNKEQLRGFVERICDDSKNSLEDTSVRNMLLNAVCVTSTSLAMHSNVIEELQKFHEFRNPIITINYVSLHNQKPIG